MIKYKLSTEIIDLGEHLLNQRIGEVFGVNKVGRQILVKLPLKSLPDLPEAEFMFENDIIVHPVPNEENSFYLQWHITNQCNLRCSICYDWKEKVKELALEEMFNVVDNFVAFLKQLKMSGRIALTGGEPMKHKQLVPLIEYIKSRDVHIDLSILTNGTFIPQRCIEIFKKYDMRIQVSIDGPKTIHNKIRGHNTYERSVRNIKRLVRNNIKTVVQAVLTKQTIYHMDEFIKHFDTYGLYRIGYTRLVPIGPGAKEQMITADQFKWFIKHVIDLQKTCKTKIIPRRPIWSTAVKDGNGSCSIGKQALCLGADGKYLACRRLPIELGDARRDSFFKVWFDSPFLKEFRNQNSFEECGKCNNFQICKGCRAIAYADSGKIFGKDPQCFHKQ